MTRFYLTNVVMLQETFLAYRKVDVPTARRYGIPTCAFLPAR